MRARWKKRGCSLGGGRRDRGVSRWSGRALASLPSSIDGQRSSRFGRSDPVPIEVTASLAMQHLHPHHGKEKAGSNSCGWKSVMKDYEWHRC